MNKISIIVLQIIGFLFLWVAFLLTFITISDYMEEYGLMTILSLMFSYYIGTLWVKEIKEANND